MFEFLQKNRATGKMCNAAASRYWLRCSQKNARPLSQSITCASRPGCAFRLNEKSVHRKTRVFVNNRRGNTTGSTKASPILSITRQLKNCTTGKLMVINALKKKITLGVKFVAWYASVFPIASSRFPPLLDNSTVSRNMGP